MKRKFIDSYIFAKDFTSTTIRVDDGAIQGYACLMQIKTVHRPLMAGGICVIGDGYSLLTFLPDNANWCMLAAYNAHNTIVEWYVDITKINAVDEDGRPYYEDLYLDAVLMPDGNVRILDEDELQEALDSNVITRSEFDLAYEALCALRKILHVSYMQVLFSKLRRKFS